MMHHFDVELATKYGLPAAIFLDHLLFWLTKNKTNKKHFHDGRYWTYNSMEAYTELFPYLSFKQIRTMLDKLKTEGLLLVGNYNLTTYDRTQWYSLSDKGHQLLGLPICPTGQMEMPDRANGIAPEGKPIPDTITDTKPAIKSSSSSSDEGQIRFEEFWKVYPKKTEKVNAKKSWIKNKLDEQADIILRDLEERIQREWQFKEKQFIPNPHRYLHNKFWINNEIIDSNSNGVPSNAKSSKNWRSTQNDNINKARNEYFESLNQTTETSVG